jgi:alginate O-acetyltransferase complex protein AlgI
LLVGYFLPVVGKRIARMLSWLLVIVTVIFSVLITSEQSALYRMIAIVSLQLLSMKVIVVVETYSHKNKLSFLQWCAFSLGWFGMRPVLFEQLPSKSLTFLKLFIKGVIRVVAGFLLIYLSYRVDISFDNNYFLSEFLLLVGLSMILHFGILNLSTGIWRLLGVDVRELFKSPYKSKSLKEFWGKRWNIAFSEMTALIAYRPLKEKISPSKAMIVSFLLSGLLHEIAISFPVNSGFGLPMIYFSIHACLIHIEGISPFVIKIIRHPVLSHVWVFVWLIVPMPLLFHADFVQFVLIPLREKIINTF